MPEGQGESRRCRRLLVEAAAPSVLETNAILLATIHYRTGQARSSAHTPRRVNQRGFQEEANGKPPVIGTLYVQRWALGEPLPQRLTVTIEAASD